ncbi:3'5'-cyclic nucleotide phosphodiesterase [Nitzschia inconspicua]|uniref:3'5'-cyclic nucleotide phosphodiesterase n=1 Tax=Nitzschia inconspicua TaxID=303405 RepID=A0A9K3PV58_9STRA|nr:3'5'-cyclic nucleotide phosphodiesterase [Nitzschia inconspicua]
MTQTKRGTQLLEMPSDFAGQSMEYEHCPFLLYMYPTATLYEDNSSWGKLMLIFGLASLFAAVAAFIALWSMPTGSQTQTGKNHWIPVTIGGSYPAFQGHPSVAAGARYGVNAKSDTFINSTVMFADIRGLATWRNDKSEEDTTNILDTVKRAMNIVAKRYGIPQVEMEEESFGAIIGSNGNDCDHAAILVLFAYQTEGASICKENDEDYRKFKRLSLLRACLSHCTDHGSNDQQNEIFLGGLCDGLRWQTPIHRRYCQGGGKKTFSMGSDPLDPFALIFAAMVHDVDHVGVSNQQLIKESSPIASLYKNRSDARRADVDPATQWYNAELAFFDKFLIPLLRRLKNSGVFGGYGEVYLKNASDNRDHWKSQGPCP